MSLYATLTQLYRFGAPEKAFGSLSEDTKLDALSAASETVDTYLRGRFLLPLVTWDVSITEATCKIAAYNLLVVRGYNPAAGADVNLLDRYNQAISWLTKVQKQQAHPNITPTQINTPTVNQPEVISGSVVNVSTGAKSTNRGW